MFAVYVAMFTIRPREIRMAGFLREHRLKNYRMIGRVLFVGRRKKNSLLNNDDSLVKRPDVRSMYL